MARLSKVMNSIVASTQTTFLKDRTSVDGVEVVNEVLYLARKFERKCMVLKVDFGRAYESVDWGYLQYMRRRFGFNAKWIVCMKACLFYEEILV